MEGRERERGIVMGSGNLWGEILSWVRVDWMN